MFNWADDEHLYETLLHELGHALAGFSHTERRDSLMNVKGDDGYSHWDRPREQWGFSDVDKAIMALLSHESVRPGMTEQELTELLVPVVPPR